MNRWIPEPRLLPLLALVLVLPALLGFWLGGPALGFTLAGLTLLALVIGSVIAKPGGRIEVGESPEHALVVFALEPITSERTAEQIADLAGGSRDDLLLVAPAPTGKLQEWLSDVDPGREQAGKLLERSAQTLGRLGLESETRVGEASFSQTVKDTLRNRGAEVVAVVGADGRERREIESLRGRVDLPLHLIDA